MTWAAITAISLSFVGKVGGILQTIPTPVMGGILVLLFAAITVKSGEDLMAPRNLAIVALILIPGVGGLSLGIGEFAVKGIGAAAILGVVANFVLPLPPPGPTTRLVTEPSGRVVARRDFVPFGEEIPGDATPRIGKSRSTETRRRPTTNS